MTPLRIVLPALLLAVIAAPASGVLAMGNDRPATPAAPAKPVDMNYTEGKKAVDAGNWAGAVAALSRAVVADPSNADAFNYLGYAHRKLGKYDDAFFNYQQALILNPEHKGAHEYLGEAYLETNNLAKAEEHLKALDKICLFSCKEYTELKARVAEFKAKKSS
jgi:tetratricopeptide (TPR) repeat protein